MNTVPHHNQQVFSDYFLDTLLPQRQDWQELLAGAEPVRQELATILARYRPGDKEAQLEHDFVRPVLKALGHTFEVQTSLATLDGTKQPDYIFYRDISALNANKGKKLTDTLLQSDAFAVGDARYWDCPLDTAMRNRSGDPFTNKNPSYQIAFYMQHSGLAWGILTNGRLWEWLVKRRLNRPDLVELTKVFRTRQPAIAALDTRISSTERLIDQVAYRLYGLSEEEVAAVEARTK